MPAVASCVKACKKAARLIRVAVPATDDTPAIIRIEVARKVALYAVQPIPNELSEGRAFLVREVSTSEGTEQYQCIATGGEPTCTCKGHQHYGHCKHVDGLSALVDAGRI